MEVGQHHMNGKIGEHNQSPEASADLFRGFEKAFKDAQIQRKQDLKNATAAARREQVKGLITYVISDAEWDGLLEQARKAAVHGEKQFLLLRFPSSLCTDDSRAINNPPNDTWPQTLRGEASEIYQRWHTVLQPHGFGLSAQVLDFPDGKPGDVGLFLRWGEALTLARLNWIPVPRDPQTRDPCLVCEGNLPGGSLPAWLTRAPGAFFRSANSHWRIPDVPEVAAHRSFDGLSRDAELSAHRGAPRAIGPRSGR